MNHPPAAERAVSEIIGALILISVIVAALALVGVMIFSQPQPQKIPALNSIISTNAQTVNIYHNGGDSFRAEDLQLLLNGQDLTSSFKEDGSAGWSTWSVGQSLTYDIPPGNPVPSLIQIVYKGGGVSHLIASLGEGSPGGVLPVQAPVVTAITPNSGLGGTVVSVTNLAGLNFFSGATVKLTRAGYADIPASGVVVVPSSQITCSFNLAGAAPGLWNVVVTNPNGPSGTLANGFTVVAAIPPVAAFTGTPLTGPIPLTVSFTDQSANIPTSWYWNFGDGHYSSLQNPTNIYSSAGNYSVSLTATNAYGSNITLKPGYIFTYIPAIANFTATPRSGPASLTVYFTDLSTGSPFSFFWQFGDIAIVNTSIAQNPGHTYDPVGVYSVNLTVANSYSSSSLVRTGYINVTQPPPTAYIINLTPTSGLPPLTVSWLGLASNAPISSWLWNFGDGSPTVTTQNANHTFASSHTYNVSLTATNAGGSGTAYQLITVYYVPTFTSITPGSGSTLGGTAVTIAGTNFADGGAFGVTIGGAAATSVVRVNSTHITAVTPAGTAGARNVVITNNGGQTATGTFTYVAPPTFTSITPNSGLPAGGTAVTIVGGNFTDGGSFGVTIGGFPATSVVRVNANTITAVTPAVVTAGARNVVVTNNDGQTATGTGAFTYFTPPPTFTTITPSSGPTAGNTPVTIVGGNFTNGGSFGVTIGGFPATSVVRVNANTITAVTPAAVTAGPKNVVITNNDGQTVTGTGAYTYVAPPTFTSITPSPGPAGTANAVTISGGNFVSGGSFGVTIGGLPATLVVRVDANTITARTPAGTVGAKDVVITNNDGQTVTGTGAYRFYTIQSFLSSTSWDVPANVNTVEYLVVAGGGGGGRYGGGGGAGGVRTGTLTGLSGSQIVTVGGFGAGSTSTSARGSNGSNSVFASQVTATGGGGGGSDLIASGAAGGSGGGGTRSTGAGGVGSQGNNGGVGARTSQYTAGGGGGAGAGAVGSAGTNTNGGNGGAGIASSITGASVTYAGGGGGGCNSARTAAGAGGSGGGGAGGDGVAGSPATGYGSGGGGGGNNGNGGAGHEGIIIIKFY